MKVESLEGKRAQINNIGEQLNATTPIHPAIQIRPKPKAVNKQQTFNSSKTKPESRHA